MELPFLLEHGERVHLALVALAAALGALGARRRRLRARHAQARTQRGALGEAQGVREEGPATLRGRLRGGEGEAAAHDDPHTATRAERYGNRIISLEVPVGFAPPGGEKDLPFLGGLTKRLRAPFLPAGANPVTRAGVLRGDSAIEWTYVALEESGAIVLFPGTRGDWDADYDPRQKPWYRAAAEGFAKRGALQTWSKPYVDGMGQGLVVTCGHVVLDPEGKFAGVAGLDVTLFRVAGRLAALEELPGFRRAVLIGEKGLELASSSSNGSKPPNPAQSSKFSNPSKPLHTGPG